jgi:murein DD-endopeptidase MepM/ murein hydrolase activator NlpD
MKGTDRGGLFFGLIAALLVGLLAAPAPGIPLPGPAAGTGPVAAVTEAVPSPGPSPAVTVPRSTPRPATPAAGAATPSRPSATPLPLDTPARPTPTPGVEARGVDIGHSVQGRPLTAYRFGEGPLKVVLVGNIHGGYEANTYELARRLVAHFHARAGSVPAAVSLWILPTINPDGLAAGERRNANDVDLNRNADTDLDGCAGNDWAPDTSDSEGLHPGGGGPHPFSEPESIALRDFLSDAWLAVFYHSAAEAIFVDTCRHHLPSARLAQVLSEATGYPVPAEGWIGYPITGDVADYLAGEGVAAVTVELTDFEDPEFERNLAGVQALLAAAGDIAAAEATATGARFVWLEPSAAGNTGRWQYPANSFVHPLALEVAGQDAYLLDAGRVLAVDLAGAGNPVVLLKPGDLVGGVRVLEPLDLAAGGGSLLVLDRAGDVYRYDPDGEAWSVERYDRPAGATYDHYYVALTRADRVNYLLETTHEQVWRFEDGQRGAAWTTLPQSRDVDVGASGGSVYVLTRGLNNPMGGLLRYLQGGRQDGSFEPDTLLMHPRQVTAAGDAVYVLDRAGRRLLALDARDGGLEALYQFQDRRAVSALWAAEDDSRLILAGRDTLYFYGESQRQAVIEDATAVLDGPQPHDIPFLQDWRGLQMPIDGAHLTSRDFQLPGAPRHYRLGVHEGMDFYGHTVGVPIDRSTNVHAVADGVVVRAILEYKRLTAAQNAAYAARSREVGYTPDDVLDGYRGRQVWIDHGGGLVSRYAHLGSIAPGIVEGALVTRGQVIATVGNSGTPGSVDSQTYDVHLHLELWVGDHFVGQFLRPIEAREWLEKILQ